MELHLHLPSFQLRLIYRCLVLIGFAFLSATVGYSQGPSFEWVVRAGVTTTSSGGYGIGYDATGNVYATGRFSGTVDFDPGTGITNLTSAGGQDTYITKSDAAGNLVWARRVGGLYDDYSFDLFIDNSGNVYVTGAFSGTADFDPGAGTFNLSSPNLFFDDIFVLKLDTDGNLAWARKIGGTDFDFGRSITVSAAGNVFTTGSFRGTVDFDPGTGTSLLTSAGGNDVFISKLNASGNFVWAKRLGGTGNDIGYAVTVDAAENVYTTGSFSTTADFDPGASVFNLTEVNNGDIFISKLDANGNFVWAKGMGGTSSDVGHSIQVDDNGNVYTSGFFHTTVDFDPGAGTTNLVSLGFNDAFICKFDVNGNYLWAKAMGGTNDEESSGIALDEYGNVYASGSFSSTVDFDPGSGIFNLTPGGNDGFVVKLDNSGNFVWAQAFDGLGGALPEAIDVDGDESIYTTGYFSGTVDFDIGAGVFNVTATGSNDTYVHKMSQASTTPTITSFTPASGPVGTTVTITGTNFSAIPNNNTVQFNGTTAAVTASTATSITCTVPSGATTGKISVTVSGNTAISTSDFTVSAPVITVTQQPVNPNNRCEGLNFTFSTDAIGTTNITFQWQKRNSFGAFENLSDGGAYSGTNTKNLLITNVQLAQAGDYRCMIQGDFASTVYCNTGTLTVNPTPTAPSVTNGSRCGDGQVTVTASGTTDGNYIWYGSNGLSEPIPSQNNSTYITSALTATTTYYVSIVNSFCESALVQVDAIINPIPAAPTVINATNDGCGTQALTLKATASSAGTFKWYETPTGTFNIAGNTTGEFITDDLSVSTTYYVSIFDGTCESSRVAHTATITNPGPGFIDNSFTPAPNSLGNWSAIDDIAIQSDGKFILNYFETAGTEYQICRLLPDGTLDPAFVQWPKTLFTAGRPDVVTLQNDGKILSGGRFTVIDGISYGRIIRLNTDGNVDGTFVTGSGFNNAVDVITVQPDNSIIIGGTFTVYNSGSANRIVRILENGTRDSGFNIGSGFNGQVKAIILRSDGKILVGGIFTSYNGSTVSGIVLLNTDGSLNSSFLPTGIANVSDIALQSDGKVILYSNEGLNRLNTDGTLDTSFNTGSGFSAAVNTIYCEPSGKILIGGDFQSVDGVTRYFVARLNPNGSLDRYFNTGIGSYTWTYEILPAGTNQIYVAGYFDKWNNQAQNGIARINNACIRTPQGFNATSCTSNITLNACGGFNGDYRWYTTASGGSPIAGETNSALTITNLTATTTYYVSLNDGVCESARVPVIATLNTPSVSAPVTTNATLCGSGSLTLSASGGTNGQYRWYTTPTGGTAISGEVNSSYTTPSLTSSNTYYVAINDGSCETARTAVIANIIPIPATPTVTNSSICGSGMATLTATGGSAGNYRWYTTATGGTPLASETNATYTTPTLTTNTTYYVAINNAGCEGNRAAATVTINTLPPKPTITITGSLTICPSQTVTLTAPSGFTYIWSTGATTQQITVSTAGNYTVEVSNGTCSSVASDPVVVTTSTCNQPPVISTSTSSTTIESSVTINVAQLVSDPDNNLDLSTLRIVIQPRSGASASIQGQSLVINYSGILFAGTDELTIEICDVQGACVQQKIFIEVIGDIVPFNGISDNGDALNSKFLIQYIEAIPETRQNKVMIYNRWGDLVWEGTNYDNTNVVFTGKNKNGNDLPTGTYFYKIEFPSRPSVSGYLSLKR